MAGKGKKGANTCQFGREGGPHGPTGKITHPGTAVRNLGVFPIAYLIELLRNEPGYGYLMLVKPLNIILHYISKHVFDIRNHIHITMLLPNP